MCIRDRDMVIKVPLGTVVRDAASGQIICDMSTREPFCLLYTSFNSQGVVVFFRTPEWGRFFSAGTQLAVKGC